MIFTIFALISGYLVIKNYESITILMEVAIEAMKIAIIEQQLTFKY